jgi:CRP/FNR family transcriptional regulator, cyclic AMP receptor protein
VRERLARLILFLRDPEHSRRAALLSLNPLFEGLPHRTIGRLLPRMFEKQYAPGDVIFRAGDPGRGLFVVLEGEVEILRHGPGAEEERRIAVFGNNTAFGELALIDEHPRSATARVVKPSRILILYRSDFESIIMGEPKVAIALARNLMRVLARYARSAASQPRVEHTDAPSKP